MGLDNIPKNYPCKTKGTAVLVARTNRETGEPITDPDTNEPMTSIDCEATQACGGCPWKSAHEAAGQPGGAVYGMLGTDCWYRGKYGEWLISEFTVADPMGENYTFYGDNEDGTEKSADSCLHLADFIDDIVADGPHQLDGEDVTEQLRYAAFWMRWVGEEADGAICWY